VKMVWGCNVDFSQFFFMNTFQLLAITVSACRFVYVTLCNVTPEFCPWFPAHGPLRSLYKHPVYFAERWEKAAMDGLVIYMHGPPTYNTLPADLPERMLDYAVHVLAAVALLFEDTGVVITNIAYVFVRVAVQGLGVAACSVVSFSMCQGSTVTVWLAAKTVATQVGVVINKNMSQSAVWVSAHWLASSSCSVL
jgi:hypothetical protein